MPAPVFIVREYGDLCNVLLTFANAAALAADHQRTLYNFVFDKYADFFAGTAHARMIRYPAAPGLGPKLLLASVGAERTRKFLFSPKWRRRSRLFLAEVAAADHVEVRMDYPPLQTFRQDRRAIVLNAWNLHLPAPVERHGERLRAYFSLAPAWKSRLEQWWAGHPPVAGPLVGVHLRRGTENYLPGDVFHRSDEFYHSRMLEMAAQLGPQTTFLLCSDVEIDLKNFPGLHTLRGPGHRILDLYSLARCQWIFGPPSTYSAWASWFGRVRRAVVLTDHPLHLEVFKVHDFE